MRTASRPKVRTVRRSDVAAITAIDAAFRGRRHPSFWRELVGRHLRRGKGGARIGVVAEDGEGEVVGYVFAQVRAVEFGSGPCGWIYAVGVRPDRLRRGVGSLLLEEATRRLSEEGVDVVRTLVRRDDEASLTFFRTNGFVGGPYLEMERRIVAPGESGS